VTPSPSPRPPLAKPGGGSPEFGRTAATRQLRGYIAKAKIIPRASLQKVNSNSKTIWLFLVNCVENHRKIRKMQNQFSRILGEISHNFCYSGVNPRSAISQKP
jgi:hypothetical protein